MPGDGSERIVIANHVSALVGSRSLGGIYESKDSPSENCGLRRLVASTPLQLRGNACFAEYVANVASHAYFAGHHDADAAPTEFRGQPAKVLNPSRRVEMDPLRRLARTKHGTVGRGNGACMKLQNPGHLSVVSPLCSEATNPFSQVLQDIAHILDDLARQFDRSLNPLHECVARTSDPLDDVFARCSQRRRSAGIDCPNWCLAQNRRNDAVRIFLG